MTQTERKHKASRYLPLWFALVLITGFVFGLFLRMPGDGTAKGRFFSIGFNRYDKLNDVINYVYETYVDSVSRQFLTEETIRGLLKNLDPHSSYIPASDFRRLNDPLMGSFEGIGIEFNMINDTVVVIQPIPGGPSEKAGLMPGDRIVRVDDRKIGGVQMSTADVVDMLMGEKGTAVNVSVFRPGLPGLREFNIVRDRIPTFSMDIAYMADERTGYMKFNKFSATTYHEFVAGAEKLLQQGMQQMILDLRGNTGGFLDAAISMADELLEAGQLIVYTDGRRRSRNYARAERRGMVETQRLVVIIDEFSASASEIIAGAVQDNDRGIIVGRKSFGKGLVQEQIQLGDGSAIRLTVARYYTPTGRSIQNPYDDGDEAYFNGFVQRFHNGEILSPDSMQHDKSLRFETPAGRVVYGGGGIMPDVFVSRLSENDLSFFNLVSNRGHIYTFAFNHADRLRNELLTYEDASGFINNFSISNAVYNDFLQFAEDQGTQPPGRLSRESEEMIKNQLKAYVGRNLFGAEAFYPVLHKKDRVFIKAMEAIYDDELMALKPVN